MKNQVSSFIQELELYQSLKETDNEQLFYSNIQNKLSMNKSRNFQNPIKNLSMPTSRDQT